MSTDPPDRPAGPSLRSVALPTEHGGWGFTIEPALLGFLVGFSPAGIALGAVGLLAFLARTPLKLALVDRWRHRRLPRTVLAERVAALELVALGGLLAFAAATAPGRFWVPLVLAAPLVVLELWFDMRSRSRRLLPELAGAIGIGSVGAAIVLADGRSARLAAGLWAVVAARAVASVPFVRVQLLRFKARPHRVAGSDVAQVAAVLLAGVGLVVDERLAVGFVAIVVLGAFHLVAVRRPAPPAPVLGITEQVLGLALVVATAAGVIIGS